MRAYELLALLCEDGLRAPPQIYRALERLIEERSVHRIEKLKPVRGARTMGAGLDAAIGPQGRCASAGLMAEASVSMLFCNKT